AIEGSGFFSARGYDGNLYYTRDGNLNINPNYDMVMTNTGFKMQGWLSTQDPKTGNLEMKETGVVPYDINITKYLKKHAHQTNEINYSCNLDS
ncbi:MAG TPA: flagellar hook protein FlgE, partial [Candidatus Rifleibacterium sp.]|nr:flagellar hook protein FlgE [Candidatus Rifleibacterium sp.]